MIVVLISVPVDAQYGGFLPVSHSMLQNPDPADWLMWRRTLNSWGYSPLNQINRSNVGQLMIWSRRMGPGVQEATPLGHRGGLYLPNPSDLVEAINAASGDLIWEYRRQLPEDVGRFLIVLRINRNIAIYGDLIIDSSVDDFVYALDARTGKLAWENRIVDYREDSAQETSGPVIGEWQNHLRARLRIQDHAQWPHRHCSRCEDQQRTCGGPEPFPSPASPATKPGAMSRTPTDATWTPGWYPASIPN